MITPLSALGQRHSCITAPLPSIEPFDLQGDVLLRVEEISSIADWFVIATGFSDVQVRAIARSVEDKIEEEGGRLPLRKEGQTEGRWVLLDYGEVIVHALTPDERSYYDLESFWGHGEQQPYLGSAQAINP